MSSSIQGSFIHPSDDSRIHSQGVDLEDEDSMLDSLINNRHQNHDNFRKTLKARRASDLSDT